MTPGRALRVLLACESLRSAGGVERFVCALAGHLAEQGFEVAVASVDTPREALRYPLAPTVRVLHGAPLGAPTGGSPWRLLRKQWRLGRVLGRLACDYAPDVLVLNGVTTACPVLALRPRLARRTICCDHNHFGARSRLWQRLRARLYPRVAAVVSLTETDRARFAALNANTHVIANASFLRADVPALPAEPRVLAVGRMVAQKGFDLLLEAWARVVAAVPEAQLRLLAEGPLEAALHAQAQRLGVAPSVDWLAPMPDIAAHYRAAAVFALPSRYEGMPLALLEAQALGVPAVAFDCPTGPREIIGPETGILVAPGDVAAFADALLALLRDPARRAAMGRAAIERQRRLFAPERQLERWSALVRAVAGR